MTDRSILDMSPTEVEAEAKRRAELQRRGLPFDTPTAQLESGDLDAIDAREESKLAAGADKQLRALGYRVINTSQPRHAKYLTPGIADRLYTHRARGVAFWWEAKTERGRQSPAQRDFQLDVEAAGQVYVLGPPRALYKYLVDAGLAILEPDGLLISTPFTRR